MTKFLLTVMMLLTASTSNSAQTVRERWSIRLTGEGGIQSFERASLGIWSAQQGVVFLTPERLLIYQVNELAKVRLGARGASGGGGNFVLAVRILDVRDGHEMDRNFFVTSAGSSSIVPTHDGKFLMRTGDILSLCSANLKPKISRPLPMGREAVVDVWQVRATVSGSKAVLLHQQIFVHPEDSPDGQMITPGKTHAAMEILNADTLDSLKKAELPRYLRYWSAGENFLVTTDPAQPLDDGHYGTMDFDSNWTLLKVPGEERQRSCTNVFMDALPHDLFAVRGCGMLTVFSESGNKEFSANVRGDETISSVASAGHYMAARFDRRMLSDSQFRTRPLHIDVFDLNSRQRVTTVNLEKAVVTYDISSQGELAVIDGDTLRLYRPE
ncbi:MAG TPA: hypothetical protein VKT33_10685 [Candidatus Angelobacter sp.]|nr:hypothetical protein [Candidatus Angelobacter sp.]